MRSPVRLAGLGAGAILAVLPAAAGAAPTDACALLTPAQIAAAVGEPYKPGEPILPTDHKVCTWRAASGASWVTVTLQNAQAADGARRMFSGNPYAKVTDVPGLGDGAYYLAAGDQVGLIVKKGAAAVKVAVYRHGPVEIKEAAEKTLASAVAPRM